MEIDNIKVEILTKEESTKYLGQMVTFPATRDNRDQESNQGCLGDVSQIQARDDLKIIPSSAHASLLRNMDTLKRTQKNDSIDAAQDAPPHRTNKKKIQEEDTGQKMKKK